MTAEHTYTFENVSNSYFMGNDVRVERDDGETIVINGKDGMCAVRVKDYWTVPERAKDAHAKLTEADKEATIESAYESARAQFWSDAEELSLERDLGGVYSAGRSGGWCCIASTSEDDWPRIAHPEDEDDREFRDNILELMFEVACDCKEQALDNFAELLIEYANDLDRQREENIILGYN